MSAAQEAEISRPRRRERDAFVNHILRQRVDVNAAERLIKILWSADDMFSRLGPGAGRNELILEIGKGASEVTGLFASDEELRRAYTNWTYESVLDHVQDEIEQVELVPDNLETWMYCLESIWDCFQRYSEEYCQFGTPEPVISDLNRRTVDLMTVFFESGALAGACSVPEIPSAALRCVDLLTRSLHRSGWEPRPVRPLADKAHVAQPNRASQDQSFKAFLGDLALVPSMMSLH